MIKALLGFRRTRVTYHYHESIIIVGFVNLYIFFLIIESELSLKSGRRKIGKKFLLSFDVSTKLLNRVLRPGDLDIFPGETLLQGVASGACLGFGVGRRGEGREDEGAGERSSLRDDISRTGNRI